LTILRKNLPKCQLSDQQQAACKLRFYTVTTVIVNFRVSHKVILYPQIIALHLVRLISDWNFSDVVRNLFASMSTQTRKYGSELG